MLPEVMVTFTATLQRELIRESRSRFVCSRRTAPPVTRLLQSLKTGDAEPLPCIALYAKPSMVRSRATKVSCAISTGHALTICRKTLLGEVTPKTRPTKDGTAESLLARSTGKSSFPKKRYALSGRRSRLGFGMQWTRPRFSGLPHQPFAALPPGSEIGEVSTNGPDAWARNDWVVAISFTVHRCNIDQMGAA